MQMIDVYDTIDTMIDNEAQCRIVRDKFFDVSNAIGTAIESGQTLENIMEANSYGMLREYLPQFEELVFLMADIVDKAMTVLALWENYSINNQSEEATNAMRTLEAFKKEFDAKLNGFNVLANTVNDHTEIAKNRLVDLGLMTK